MRSRHTAKLPRQSALPTHTSAPKQRHGRHRSACRVTQLCGRARKAVSDIVFVGPKNQDHSLGFRMTYHFKLLINFRVAYPAAQRCSLGKRILETARAASCSRVARDWPARMVQHLPVTTSFHIFIVQYLQTKLL